jgi:hypothetical protein
MKRLPLIGAVLAAALLVTVLSSCSWGSGGGAEEGTPTKAAGPPAGGKRFPRASSATPGASSLCAGTARTLERLPPVGSTLPD